MVPMEPARGPPPKGPPSTTVDLGGFGAVMPQAAPFQSMMMEPSILPKGTGAGDDTMVMAMSLNCCGQRFDPAKAK